jgi:hypothetical protein
MTIIRPNPLTDELKQTIATELNAIAAQHSAALEYTFKRGSEITAGGSKNPEILKFLSDFLKPEPAPERAPQAIPANKPGQSLGR